MLNSIEARLHIRAPRLFEGSDSQETQGPVLDELLSHQWEVGSSDLPPFSLRKVDDAEVGWKGEGFGLWLHYVHAPALPTDLDHWVFRAEAAGYDPEAAFANFAARHLVFSARQLILCANIAWPGVLSVLNFRTQVGGHEQAYYATMLSDLLSHASADSRKRNWPPIHTDLSVQDVWLWARSIEGFSEGAGRTPVGRALAAFSHLFSPSFAPAPGQEMFWALLGLEAIFGRGRDGLAEQLRAKSAVLLGSPATHKKLVTKMYDFRSRFVHGDLDLPFQEAPFDELENFTEKMDDVQLTGIALLLSTLQALVKMGRAEIAFEYRLV